MKEIPFLHKPESVVYSVALPLPKLNCCWFNPGETRAMTMIMRMIVIMLRSDPHGDYDQMMIGIIRMVALIGSWDDHNNPDDHDEWNSDNILPIATPIRSWHWLPSFYIFLLKRLFF